MWGWNAKRSAAEQSSRAIVGLTSHRSRHANGCRGVFLLPGRLVDDSRAGFMMGIVVNARVRARE